MNPILRNILGFIAGLVIGMAANVFFINVSGKVIALPEGVDPNNFETLKVSIANGDFGFKNYIMPFIAHSSQAFLGALICTKVAVSQEKTLSLVLGGIGIIGGIAWDTTYGNSNRFNFCLLPNGIVGLEIGYDKDSEYRYIRNY
jgi:hypothetical protein